VGDDRPVYAEPGSAGYAKLTALQQRDAWILWKARLENVPEYRLNLFGKYTFTDNFLGDYGRGLTTGLGLRYSSKTVVSRSVDWNPLGGGYQAGNYLVWDLTLGYPFQVMGYKLRANLGIYNVTDEKYSEGSFAMSPARNWVFSTGMSF
jgi:outer membrane receptor protein involved in Fe transport